MRKTEIERKTTETSISLSLDIEGSGKYSVSTGCGFLNHMIELFARHGRFDIDVKCVGDTEVDYHHTVEDVAIVMGRAFDAILSDRRGIVRYGSCVLPMDETLVIAAVDISGRAVLNFDVNIPAEHIGDFDTELVKEFMFGFTRALGASIHFKQLAGENSHHIAEAVFKSFARAMSQAVAKDERYKDEIPSTKGLI